MSPLLNVWKFFGKLRKKHRRVQNKHSDKFPKFMKIFANLRKSSGTIGKCRKVLKMTFQHFLIFSEIFGNHRKFLDVFGRLRKFVGSLWKSSEKIGKCRKVLKTIFRQCLKIFGNLRKYSEMLGNFANPRKIFKGNQRFMNIFL